MVSSRLVGNPHRYWAAAPGKAEEEVHEWERHWDPTTGSQPRQAERDPSPG